MSNRFLISAAAIALIAGAPAVYAQGNMNREGGAAMQQGTQSGGGAGGASTPKEPSSGMKSTQSEQQKSPGEAKGQRAEEPGMKSKSQGAEKEMKGGAKGQRAEEPGQKSKSLSTETETKGGAKGQRAEEPGQKSKTPSTQSEIKGGAKDMNAQTRTDERSQTTTGQAGAAAKLSTEQRTRITTVIRNEHVAPLNNVDFSISVGTRVPRERISLRPLPVEVITIYPEWRGYEFFLVRDEIIVVDPRTLEIVAVLPV